MEFQIYLNLVLMHFLRLDVTHISLFDCWNLFERVDAVKVFSEHLISINFVLIGDMKKLKADEHPKVGIFLDYKCENSSNILQKADELNLFTSNYFWLVLALEPLKNKNFEDGMSNKSLNIGTEMIFGNLSNPDPVEISMFDVYNNGREWGGQLNVTFDRKLECSEFDCTAVEVSALSLRSKYGNRCNLAELTLPAVSVILGIPITTPEEDILYYLEHDQNITSDSITKYGHRVQTVVRDMLNYNIKYVFTSLWGQTAYRSNFEGAVGKFVSQDAAIGATNFILDMERAQFIAIYMQTGTFKTVFVFRTPNEGIAGQVFLKPFSQSVWICIIVFVAIFAVYMKVIFAFEFRNLKSVDYVPSLMTSFLMSFGLFCCQDALLLPRGRPGRIAFIALILCSYFLYNYYASIVVSSLVQSPVKSSITTVSDLAESKLEIGIEDIIYNRKYLDASNASDIKALVRNKVDNSPNSSTFLNLNEGLERVNQGSFAYQAEATTLYRTINKIFPHEVICDLNEVVLRSENSYGMAVKIDSPLREVLRIKGAWMAETGILDRHRRNYYRMASLTCFERSSIAISVGFEYTAPLFIFLLGFFAISVFVLLFEIAVNARFGKMEKNYTKK